MLCFYQGGKERAGTPEGPQPGGHGGPIYFSHLLKSPAIYSFHPTVVALYFILIKQ